MGLVESDIELISLIRRHKDRNAGDRLISRYYKYIYKQIYLKVNDVELAMDLTQETFIGMLKGLNTFDGSQASFKTWLSKLAANKVVDYFRSRQHHEQILTDIIGTANNDSGDNGDSFSNFMDSNFFNNKNSTEVDAVEQRIISKLTSEKILKYLSKIEFMDRKVFLLKAQQGYTFEEIGRLMGISDNTAKTKYYSVLKKLRKEFDDYA